MPGSRRVSARAHEGYSTPRARSCPPERPAPRQYDAINRGGSRSAPPRVLQSNERAWETVTEPEA